MTCQLFDIKKVHSLEEIDYLIRSDLDHDRLVQRLKHVAQSQTACSVALLQFAKVNLHVVLVQFGKQLLRLVEEQVQRGGR